MVHALGDKHCMDPEEFSILEIVISETISGTFSSINNL